MYRDESMQVFDQEYKHNYHDFGLVTDVESSVILQFTWCIHLWESEGLGNL